MPPATDDRPVCPREDCTQSYVHGHSTGLTYSPRPLRDCLRGECHNVRVRHKHGDEWYEPANPCGKANCEERAPHHHNVVGGRVTTHPGPIPQAESVIRAEDPFRPGMWVRVWGVVAAPTEGWSIHPEDLVVTTRTHNAENQIVVRRDHVEFAMGPTHPASAPRCGSLYQAPTGPEDMLTRCALHDGPGHRHKNGVTTWADKDAAGWMEEQ